MKKRDGNFAGAADMSIYYHYWEPDAQPRALILLVHGAGEHCARYEHFARYLTDHGYAVAALDHPGHGRSTGTPGHVERFDDYMETLRTFHQQVVADFSGVPQILLGHSMGGLISSLYLLQHQQDFIGCILSGPAIKTDIEPGVLQMYLIRFLSTVLPRAGVLQLDATGVSRDPAEVEKYVNDPLVFHGKMSARKVSELFKAMHHIQAEAGKITLPMLLLHGGEDAMAAAEGSRFLYSRISSTDKTLKIYPGLYHEIFNEPEQEEVFADVLAWCNERTTA
jgi:alpha-beta hydrolase superfamily lysophospholipase